MAVERVIIEIVGDTKQINSTITQLEKLGKVDKANAETFKKTNEAARNEINKTKSSLGGLDNAFNDLKSQIVGAFAVGSLIAFGKEAIQTAAKIDSITKSLEFITGGSKQAAATMEYLKNLSNRLGLEFQSTAQAFKLFAGATTQSGMSLNQTKTIFESVAKATTTMGLSADDANGVFLALSQIMSKGKVSAEELRGQIGERLPGAFAIAAKSIGVTEQQLNKMLEQGQVISKDFLPKFAKQLEKDLGGGAESAANSLQASLNRISNSFTELFSNVGNKIAPFVKLVAKSFEGINAAIAGEGKIIEDAGKQSGESYAAKVIADLEKIQDASQKFDATLDKRNFFQKRLTQTQNELNAALETEKKIKTEGGRNYAGRLTDIKAEIEALSGNKAMYSQVITELNGYSDELKKVEAAENSETDAADKNTKKKAVQLTEYEKLVFVAGELGKKLQDLYALKGTGAGDTVMEIKLRTVLSQLEMIDDKLKQVKDGFDEAQITSGTVKGGTAKPITEAINDYSKEKKPLELATEGIKTKEQLEKDYTDMLAEEEAKRIKIAKEAEETKRTIAMATVQATFELIDMAMQYANNAAQQQLNYELRLNEENFQKKKINEIAYEKNRSAILNRQNELQKQQAIAMAIINTAQAVVNALATGGAAAPALAIIAGIMGAAQIATIIATPLPKYAEGTDFVKLGKNKKGVDTVHAMLNEGEAVIKTKENAKYPGLSKAWNDGKIESYITKRFLLPNMEAKPMRGLESNLFAENVAKSIRLNQDMFGVESGLNRLNKTEIESTNIIVEAIKQSKRQNIW